MSMETKSAAVEIKTNSTPGEFEAIISAIGNVDRQGDRVMPGAFKSAIENDPVPPVYWSHKHEIPPIGSGYEWFEKGTNVHYKGALFVDGEDSHQFAQMVYAGMKERGDGRAPAINQFSYTYGVAESERVEEDGKNIRLLHEIRPVAEVGPCFIGANDRTALVSPAKSGDLAKLVVARKNVGRRGVSMKQLLTDTLGLKDYGDIDGYEIRMLLDMLDSAVSFIQFSDEDDDVVAMQGVATTLLGMLSAEFAEVTDLMAAGDAIDAILNNDDPGNNVTVTVDIESASADAEAAKLAKKSTDADASKVDDVPAEKPKAAEGADASEKAAAVAADESADESGKNEDADAPKQADVSSDTDPTVSNEIARLALTWPSH